MVSVIARSLDLCPEIRCRLLWPDCDWNNTQVGWRGLGGGHANVDIYEDLMVNQGTESTNEVVSRNESLRYKSTVVPANTNPKIRPFSCIY